MKDREISTASIQIRMPDDDRAWLEEEAKRNGLGMSAFVRMTLKRERNARERDAVAA